MGKWEKEGKAANKGVIKPATTVGDPAYSHWGKAGSYYLTHTSGLFHPRVKRIGIFIHLLLVIGWGLLLTSVNFSILQPTSQANKLKLSGQKKPSGKNCYHGSWKSELEVKMKRFGRGMNHIYYSYNNSVNMQVLITFNWETEQRQLNSCCSFREGFPGEETFEVEPSLMKVHSYLCLYLNILSV